MKGTVLWFRNELGYGFLRDDVTNEEFYFHWTSIMSVEEYKTVFTGQPVNFELIKKKINDEDAFEAINIRLLPRINNETQKYVLLVAYVDLRGDISLNELNFRINRVSSAGLRYIKEKDGYMISCDNKLDDDEALIIIDIIRQNQQQIDEDVFKCVRKVIKVDNLKYDIMFM